MLAACECHDSIEGDEVGKDESFIKVPRGRPIFYVRSMKNNGSRTWTTISFPKALSPKGSRSLRQLTCLMMI